MGGGNSKSMNNNLRNTAYHSLDTEQTRLTLTTAIRDFGFHASTDQRVAKFQETFNVLANIEHDNSNPAVKLNLFIHQYSDEYSALFQNLEEISLIRLKDAYATIAQQLLTHIEAAKNSEITVPLAVVNPDAYYNFVQELRGLPDAAEQYQRIYDWLTTQVAEAAAKIQAKPVTTVGGYTRLNDDGQDIEADTTTSSVIQVDVKPDLSQAAKNLTALEYTNLIDAFVAQALLAEKQRDDANAAAANNAGSSWKQWGVAALQSLKNKFTTSAEERNKVAAMTRFEWSKYRVAKLRQTISTVSAGLTAIIFFQMAGRATEKIADATNLAWLNSDAIAGTTQAVSATLNGAVAYRSTAELLPRTTSSAAQAIQQWNQIVSPALINATSGALGLFFVTAIAAPNIKFGTYPLSENIPGIISVATDFFIEMFGARSSVTVISNVIATRLGKKPRAMQAMAQLETLDNLAKILQPAAINETSGKPALRNLVTALLVVFFGVVFYGGNGYPLTGAQDFIADITNDTSNDFSSNQAAWIFVAALLAIPGLGLGAFSAYNLVKDIYSTIFQKMEPSPFRAHYPITFWINKIATYSFAFIFSGFSNAYLNLLFAERMLNTATFRAVQILTGAISAGTINAEFGANVAESLLTNILKLKEQSSTSNSGNLAFNKACNAAAYNASCMAALDEFSAIKNLADAQAALVSQQETATETEDDIFYDAVSEPASCWDSCFEQTQSQQVFGALRLM